MKKSRAGKIIIGGIFFLANSLLTGCDEADDRVQQGKTRSFADDTGSAAYQPSGVMTMVEEIAPGDFRIAQEYPSKTTGVVVKHLDGSKEAIPEEKLSAVMEQAKQEKGMGLGSVLTAGLVGYLMGKNSALSPYVYKDDNLYRQSLLNRELVYKQQEEEDKRRGYTGYWSGGRYYGSSRRAGGDAVRPPATGSAKTGFFSRLSSGFRSFTS
jgi:hypothetical protein